MKSYHRTSAPDGEPVSLEDIMRDARVDNADEAPSLEGYIAMAREWVEDFTGRVLLPQTWRMRTDAWPSGCGFAGRRLVLERTPLVSVESVKYYPADGSAQATLSSAAYIVETDTAPGMIELVADETWPDLADRFGAVEVNFTAGYGSADLIPRKLSDAVLLIANTRNEIRTTTNIGNIVNDLPAVRHLLESMRVGGWIG